MKIIFFTIFGAGLIASHYGISYVFMLLVAFVLMISFLTKKQVKIKLAHITLFFVLAFSWYIYTAQSASFNSFVEMGQNIAVNFWSELLSPQSRSQLALQALGIGPAAVSIGHLLGRSFHYVTQFFIVFGVVGIVLGYEKHYKFDRDYVLMSGFMLIFALFPLIAPSFNLLNVTRMYHISLLFLAPFCVIGGINFFSYLPKLRKGIIPFILTLIIIVSLFLFETGFVYELTMDVSYSVPLSLYRMDRVNVYGYGYITERVDVAGAEWLHSNIVLTTNTLVYADVVSVNQPLTSYGIFSRDRMETLSNATSFRTNA